jgi:hypothetical protein
VVGGVTPGAAGAGAADAGVASKPAANASVVKGTNFNSINVSLV